MELYTNPSTKVTTDRVTEEIEILKSGFKGPIFSNYALVTMSANSKERREPQFYLLAVKADGLDILGVAQKVQAFGEGLVASGKFSSYYIAGIAFASGARTFNKDVDFDNNGTLFVK